jgi:large subunit ribosomal protein L6
MSRVGKLPVSVPAGVDVVLGDRIVVKGTLGSLEMNSNKLVRIERDGEVLRIAPVDESTAANAMSGTFRQLVNNMVHGVSKGFEKKLSLIGVGYRAQAQGDKLNLSAGYSHPVVMQMPAGVKVECPTQTEILIKGADRQQVGQVAAEVRAVRPPEPYKGKGIRYADERVAMKEAKKK